MTINASRNIDLVAALGRFQSSFQSSARELVRVRGVALVDRYPSGPLRRIRLADR